MNEKKHLSDEEIDEIVSAQVDDDAAWEEAIEVEPNISLTIDYFPHAWQSSLSSQAGVTPGRRCRMVVTQW